MTSPRFAKKCDTISQRYHISMVPAHTLVAQACLGILLHLDENITEEGLRGFPLTEYAAKHWVEHARFEGVLQNLEEGMKQLFDAGKPHLAVWVRIYDPNKPWSRTPCQRPFPPLGTPLHYAALCGLHGIMTVLVTVHPQDVHSRRFDDESTPLHLASQKGYLEAAFILVNHGANVGALDKNGLSPLHQASINGYFRSCTAPRPVRCRSDNQR